MRKYREDSYVVCPFYRSENSMEIRCSGIVGDFTTSTFQTKSEKERFKTDFCCSKCYLGCPVFQAEEVFDGQETEGKTED